MRIQLQDVGIISSCDVEFIPGINLIIGSSGSGKSTLMRCIYNVATNEFSDSDISFGKNTMTVKIDDNGNNIEYSRSIKTKGEKCYYKVNGESYVKLGRQILPAVAETLKIGDIDINGDSINFNFNLQFSSPFLILGNQSTLYNVLTYRSTFDISSINDYYTADIRTNASDIADNTKLKERLESSLNSLEQQAEKLSPVEQLYSDYTLYKHKLEIVNDLNMLLEKSKQIVDVSNNLCIVDELLYKIASANSTASMLKEITSYNEINREYHSVKDKVTSYNKLVCSYSKSISLIQNVIDFKKLLVSMKQHNVLLKDLKIISKCEKACKDVIEKEPFVNDIIKQQQLVNRFEKCKNICELLCSYDDSAITKIEHFISAAKYIESINELNTSIDATNEKQLKIEEELSKFKVCPLCGVSLDGHKEH